MLSALPSNTGSICFSNEVWSRQDGNSQSVGLHNFQNCQQDENYTSSSSALSSVEMHIRLHLGFGTTTGALADSVILKKIKQNPQWSQQLHSRHLVSWKVKRLNTIIESPVSCTATKTHQNNCTIVERQATSLSWRPAGSSSKFLPRKVQQLGATSTQWNSPGSTVFSFRKQVGYCHLQLLTLHLPEVARDGSAKPLEKLSTSDYPPLQYRIHEVLATKALKMIQSF